MIMGVSNTTVLDMVGANSFRDDVEDIPNTELYEIIKAENKKLEKRAICIVSPLSDNLCNLARLTGLKKSEIAVLGFAVLLSATYSFEEITDSLGRLSFSGLIASLSIILRLDAKKITAALSSKGLLAKTGLLTVRHKKGSMESRLEVMESMATILLIQQSDIAQALEYYFTPSRKAKLTADDYVHLKTDFDFLHRYLSKAGKKNRKGVNILIYGKPGTGKTELVRTLAVSLNRPLYEVTSMDENDVPLEPNERVHAYQLSQVVMSRTPKALLLFDEIEDVFPHDGLMEMLGMRANRNQQKAWINRVLEENAVPTLWVSNAISHIDAAFIRRFDYVLEVKEPPRSRRREIIEHYTVALPVSEAWLRRIASNTDLAPGVVARSAQVAATLEMTDQRQTEATLDRILTNSLTAMGYSSNLRDHSQSPMTYRPDLLNPDYELGDLLKGLANRHQGRLCLYGPPGTGKSAFGRHIADYLDKPLLVRRASDLLDAYVGGTEQRLRNMFEETQRENAVLLLDEADSFLQSRRAARQPWQISQVNELLTQMEGFNGIFICSTNLLETLDEAAMRRFDLKIKFDFLQPAQVWLLFKQVLKDLGNTHNELANVKRQVMGLNQVTPGDFATVVRQNNWQEKPSGPQELYERLAKEVSLKTNKKNRGIGFTNNL